MRTISLSLSHFFSKIFCTILPQYYIPSENNESAAPANEGFVCSLTREKIIQVWSAIERSFHLGELMCGIGIIKVPGSMEPEGMVVEGRRPERKEGEGKGGG